jgi:Ca2+-binding RTX toxin-like protein
VRGSQFADSIRGSTGNDTLQGNGGNDAFVYLTPTFGNGTITDFTPGAGTDDFIQFDHTVLADFNAVMAAAAQVGANTVITVSPGNSITLLNVSLSSLHQTDFVFV